MTKNILNKEGSAEIAVSTIFWGLIVFLLLLITVAIWGIFAPINSASIAQGQIVLDFNRKTISHLEGGIVEQILVHEGEMVEKDQPIVILNNIKSKSETLMLKKQLTSHLAVLNRLIAERDNGKLSFDNLSDLYQDDADIKKEVSEVIQTQKHLFNAKQNAVNSKIDIFIKKINGLKEEIAGINAQQIAIENELKILYQQQQMIEKLVNNNNSPVNKLLEINKQIAVKEGLKGELIASKGKTKLLIAQTEMELVDFRNENNKQILSEIQDIEIKISSLKEQFSSSEDVLNRTIIKAPVSGIVTNMQYHTIGSVVTAASPIMYIVPQDDDLIVEAKVNPIDIDNVNKDLVAKVQFTGFKAKKLPKLDGKVLSVSPDILTNDQTGEQYFLARVKIEQSELEKLKEKIILQPGMPAQVFIINGSRNLFSYLFSPIKDSGYKAFREE